MNEKHNLGRIGYLLNELYENGYFTRKGLSDFIFKNTKSEVSVSTIRRSVDDLRDYFGLDIIFNKKVNKYFVNDKQDQAQREESFHEKFGKIKRLPAKRQELMIFYSFVKSMIFSEYYFPPMDSKGSDGEVRDYEQILRIIEGILKDELSEKDIKLANRIEYHLSQHYKLSQKNKFNAMLNILLDSMRYENLVKFIYHETEVYVEPVKIIHYEGKWYFAGYVARSGRADNLHKVRTYNMSYIKDNIHLTREKFTGDDYFVPDYKDSFGIIASTNIETAKIRFYGQLADIMKEILWYDDQKTVIGEDVRRGKYCEFTLPYPVNTSYELIARVLSYGDAAEIIEPAELRKEWIDTIKKMYGNIKE